MDRVGYYCWAGPSMVRMTNLKFFNPRMDLKSLMSSYDCDYLARIKDKFNITDFWAMYSWGFSEKTEQEDYDFLAGKVENFKKLDLKLHAYVQGPNVVYKEFPDVDWYCVDNKNRPITYYRGRRVVCVNNSGFLAFKKAQIEKMFQYDFNGIYMDNIQMGQMPVPTTSGALPYTFAGCNCKYCRTKFKEQSGEDIPLDLEKDSSITKKYLEFRVNSVTSFLKEISDLVHSKNLQFGTNSFDPKFNMEYTFGTNLKVLDSLQDYLLFENHSLPSKDKSNLYINDLCKSLKKPVFVLSYKKGIGKDSEFTQQDLDNIATEDKECLFYSCIKGSEYYTNNVWHNLYVDDYQKPELNKSLELKNFGIKSEFGSPIINNRISRRLIKWLYNPFFTEFMENKFWRMFLVKFYKNII